MWAGLPPAGYAAAADEQANTHQRSGLGADARCTVN